MSFLTEHEFLKSIPASLKYSNSWKYDFFAQGRHQEPTSIEEWSNFMLDSMVQTRVDFFHLIPIPQEELVVEKKSNLCYMMEKQILFPIKSFTNFSHLSIDRVCESHPGFARIRNPELEMISRSFNSPAKNIGPINWLLRDDGLNRVLMPIALRSNLVINKDFKPDFQIIQLFDYMCLKNLQYGVLSTYETTWFLKRSNPSSTKLLISPPIYHNSENPTIREAFHYMFTLVQVSRIATEGKQNIPSNPNNDTNYFDCIKGNVIKKLGENTHLVQYNINHFAVVKHCPETDGSKFSLILNEARVLEKLENIQTIFVPKVLQFEIISRRLILCTEFIKPAENSELKKIHEDQAMMAIEAIHKHKILHNNLEISNFFLGYHRDTPEKERIFILNFSKSQVSVKGNPIPLDFFLEEKVKLQRLFNSL
ncbi:hypothetical protein G9A89_001147 [Geosiphon pyriformis]|nr:hypothetical protein G9A89_001147 [Geosiphon pyriformis]